MRVLVLLSSDAVLSLGDRLFGRANRFQETVVYIVAASFPDISLLPKFEQSYNNCKIIGSVVSKPSEVLENGETLPHLNLLLDSPLPRVTGALDNDQTIVFQYETPCFNRLFCLDSAQRSPKFADQETDDGISDNDLDFALASVNSIYERRTVDSRGSVKKKIQRLFLHLIHLCLVILSFLADITTKTLSSWSKLALGSRPGLLSFSRLVEARCSYQAAAISKNRKLKSVLRRGNFIYCVGCDILLGLILLAFIWQGDTAQELAHQVASSAQSGIDSLKSLLYWFSDAPAGLKVNRDLNQFLNDFFLYLITIWNAYLVEVVMPCLSYVVLCIGLSGMMGLSVALALTDDLLSVMTLHVYCFYVFAAKIYSLQVYALGSLWRLFTGKKWNVLRQRVDSFQYNINQLLLGTLFFTILVFLLPTVGLYYLLFTVIRLGVLVLHSLFNWILSALVHFPVYSLLLWTVDAKQLPAGIRIDLMEPSNQKEHFSSSQVIISLKSQPVGLLDAFWYASSKSVDLVDDHGDNLGKTGALNFVASLLKGFLVYPWPGWFSARSKAKLKSKKEMAS